MLFSPRPSLSWIKPVLETTSEDVAAALALNVVAATNAEQLWRLRTERDRPLTVLR
jgi:hypothetical protein